MGRQRRRSFDRESGLLGGKLSNASITGQAEANKQMPGETLFPPQLAFSAKAFYSFVTGSLGYSNVAIDGGANSLGYVTQPWNSQPSTSQVETYLNAGLAYIMAFPPYFVSLVELGHFQGPTQMSIPSPSNNGVAILAVPLATHILSVVMKGQGWSARPLSVTTLDDFIHNSDPLCVELGTNMCKNSRGWATYWSPVTGRQYQLEHNGKGRAVDVYALLSGIDNTRIDLPSLFDRAYQCTAAWKAGSVNSLSLQLEAGDLGCLSVLPIYLSSKETPCPADLSPSDECPFGYYG